MSALSPFRANRAVAPGLALVLATILVSGVSNAVNFHAVQGSDVDAWIAVRNSLVAVLLVPFVLLVRSAPRPRLGRADWVRLSVIGVVGGAIPFLLYFHGFQMASAQGGAATASLGYRSLFLMASVFAVVFLKERLARRYLLGAGLVMVGNAFLLSISGPVWTDGTAYVLLATAMWAGEYALSKQAMRTLPSGTVALARMGVGAAVLLAYVGLTGHASSLVAFSGQDWMTILLSALLLLAFVATWYSGLKTTDLSVASALLVLAFPITWVLGTLSSGLGIALGPAIGAGLVALGVAVVVGFSLLRHAVASVPRWLRARWARGD